MGNQTITNAGAITTTSVVVSGAGTSFLKCGGLIDTNKYSPMASSIQPNSFPIYTADNFSGTSLNLFVLFHTIP